MNPALTSGWTQRYEQQAQSWKNPTPVSGSWAISQSVSLDGWCYCYICRNWPG